MTQASWVQLANNEQFNQITAGQALSNSVSLTDVSAGANVSGEGLSVLGNTLYAGMQLRFIANGIASTTGSPQLTLGVYFGGIAGTALATTTFAASANMTNNCWKLDAMLRCETTGTSGQVRTIGQVHGLSSSPAMLPATSSNGNLVTIATGSSNLLTLGAQWSVGNPSNSITCYQWLVEQLN